MRVLMLCLFFAAVTGTPFSRKRPLGNRLSLWRTRHFPSKIIGGSNVTPGELPYQVSIQDISFGFPFHFCGGSIVSDSWVLTAAHCFDDVDTTKPDFLQIVAGEHNLVTFEGTEQEIILSEIRIHENYDSWTVVNDVALLKLSVPLTFNSFVLPIALPSKNQVADGDCLVSGWGSTTEEGDPSDTLQKATVPMMSEAECNDLFGADEIDDCMICAGLIDGGIDACEGDSGGPLVCTNPGNSQFIAGVVSWGYGCARPGFPGVYSEISCYVDWINGIISA